MDMLAASLQAGQQSCSVCDRARSTPPGRWRSCAAADCSSCNPQLRPASRSCYYKPVSNPSTYSPRPLVHWERSFCCCCYYDGN